MSKKVEKEKPRKNLKKRAKRAFLDFSEVFPFPLSWPPLRPFFRFGRSSLPWFFLSLSIVHHASSPSHPCPPCLKPMHPSLFPMPQAHASSPAHPQVHASSPCQTPVSSPCLKPILLFPSHLSPSCLKSNHPYFLLFALIRINYWSSFHFISLKFP